MLRGANWNDGSDAGPFAVNLNNAPSNTNIGFHCAWQTWSNMKEVSSQGTRPWIRIKAPDRLPGLTHRFCGGGPNPLGEARLRLFAPAYA